MNWTLKKKKKTSLGTTRAT